jgi:hypothetical protein
MTRLFYLCFCILHFRCDRLENPAGIFLPLELNAEPVFVCHNDETVSEGLVTSAQQVAITVYFLRLLNSVSFSLSVLVLSSS